MDADSIFARPTADFRQSNAPKPTDGEQIARFQQGINALLRRVIPPNKWTNLLDRMTEPLLSPIRAQLNKHLPESWNAVDLSPLVLLLLVWLVRAILL